MAQVLGKRESIEEEKEGIILSLPFGFNVLQNYDARGDNEVKEKAAR